MTLVLNPQTQTTMKAALFYQPGDVRYEEVPMPKPATGEIVVKVETALTCGTDLKAFRRGHPVLLKNFPAPFGHECSGIVTAIGKGFSHLSVGDRVVAANSAPCQTCFFCKKAQYNLCEHLDLLNGAYADYIKIPAQIAQHNTLIIPEHVPFEAAAFTEPLSVSLRGIEACHINPGDTVAVIGLGAIGQFMIKLAKLRGAHVVGLGRNPLKRKMAESFACADAVLNLNQFSDPQQIVEEFTPGGYGFDVVIEAVGLPTTWEKAIQMVRRGGLVNLFGGCESGSTVALETRRIHYDEITLVSPFHHTPSYFRKALTLITEGQLDPTQLISLELPLHCVTEALELVSEGKAVKVALKPDNN